MYLDRNTVVTLEYHYYQKDCSYVQFKRRNETFINTENKHILKNETGTEVTNKLGTQNFLYVPEDED